MVFESLYDMMYDWFALQHDNGNISKSKMTCENVCDDQDVSPASKLQLKIQILKYCFS